MAGLAFNPSILKNLPKHPAPASPVVKTQASVTSLEDDLQTKEQFKYDPLLERTAKEWIEAVLQESFPEGSTFANGTVGFF